MAGSSEEDRRRQLARFARQGKHRLTHEQERQQQQQAKTRKARQTPRRHESWSPDDEDPAQFERMSAMPRERPRPPVATQADLPVGTVTAVHAGRIEVDGLPARLAAALDTDPDQRLAVGDEVLIERTAGPLRILARRPRRSVLARPDPGNPHHALVLAANVDVAVLVVAVADPPLRTGLIDRFLVAVQRGGIAPLLCIHKVDLLDDPAANHLAITLRPYLDLGIPMVRCSARTGVGIEALRAHLRGKTCVVAGHSGVGKSSLLNALDPDASRAVGAVRDYDGKGRHTTTASALRRLGDGTCVIDTPGIRELGLGELSRDELVAAFPDLQAFAAHCRFRDCAHASEPDCAVHAAVAAGQLAATRLAAWRRLHAEREP